MSKEQNEDGKLRTRSLATLRQQKADLEERFEEHNQYLNEVATYLSSCEEQQRIVGDIEDLRREIMRIDESIAAMTRQTPSE